jgi:hypothetical protein
MEQRLEVIGVWKSTGLKLMEIAVVKPLFILSRGLATVVLLGAVLIHIIIMEKTNSI